MGFLTPGFFTRWVNEHFIKHQMAKDAKAAEIEKELRNRRIYNDHHRATHLSEDERFAVRIKVVREGLDLEGLVLTCPSAGCMVVFLTMTGSIIRISLVDVESYVFDWDRKLGLISNVPISADDVEEYERLCKDLADRRPALIPKIFANFTGFECETLPYFNRNGEFFSIYHTDANNVFLLGYNAEATLTLSELKDLSATIRREEMAHVERWFNAGAWSRKPIQPGYYIKLGNELVGVDDRETEWLVVETYKPPLMHGQRLVDLLAYNLEDQCFQSLLSYNFHVSGVVTPNVAMFEEGV